ncbi:hypothetical protein LCGC14_1100480 [marine sediment metagenome]|uniref:Uncharacterized protein n=1 Tax=marine sediment metagenome TaxID=412755 RepID=A0A0F9M9L2_9ZZZZ
MPITDEAIKSLGVGPTELTPEERVQKLLETLDLPKAEEPKRFGRGKAFLAGLGDAFTAKATVRAGGTPPAIGASTLIRQRRLAGEEARRDNAEAARRDISNRLHIGLHLAKEDRRTKIAVEKIKVQAEIDKRQNTAEAGLRKAYIDKVIELGIDTGGLDLNTMETSAIKKLIDDHDPLEGFNATLENLPADMSPTNMRFNKDGSISFDLKKKGSEQAREFPAFLVKDMVDNGEEGVGQLFSDPATGELAEKVSASNRAKSRRNSADKILADIRKEALANDTDIRTGLPDLKNVAIAEVVLEVQDLGLQGANEEQIQKWYFEQVDLVVSAIERNKLSELDGTDIIEAVRQMISVKFGIQLPVRPNVPGIAPPDFSAKKSTGKGTS